MNQAAFADEVGAQQSYVSKWEGKGMVPDTGPLERIAKLAGTSISELRAKPWTPAEADASDEPAAVTASADDTRMVGIQFIEQDFGLGATFTNEHAKVDVIQFPKVWVETVSISPPSLLTWASGSGDSMSPTIDHGDMVLIDRSKKDIDEQDQMWAFTVGETASIKRLRRKGDRFVILSDNPSVPPDEEPMDFVHIVGRVVFVGKRK